MNKTVRTILKVLSYFFVKKVLCKTSEKRLSTYGAQESVTSCRAAKIF